MSSLSFFSFINNTFAVASKKSLSNPKSQRYSYMIQTLSTLGFAFRLMIHCKLIFVYGANHGSDSFIYFFSLWISSCSTTFDKGTTVSPFSKILWAIYQCLYFQIVLSCSSCLYFCTFANTFLLAIFCSFQCILHTHFVLRFT